MLTLNPHTTALVLIDVQKGILAMPLAPHPPAKLVQSASHLAMEFMRLGGTIIFTRAAFSEGYADKLNQPVDVPFLLPSERLPADWSDFPLELASMTPHVHIVKRQWSAFFGTELDLQLRRRGIRTIVLGGVATNFGVESTARDGWQHNYNVVVAHDASSSLSVEMHLFATEKILPRVALVRSVAEITSALHTD